jgi:hypothetical protein
LTHSKASTAAFPLVYTDPFAKYVAQEDSIGNNIAVTQVGLLFDLVDAGPNATTGLSGQEIDSSTGGTSGTYRVAELYRAPNNATGANAKWVVTFAEHQDLSDAVSV